jgi:hypothetical protein
MSDATLQALITNAPAIITAMASVLAATGAIIGVLVSLRNGAKADVIVGHVNSAATKSAAEIAALRHEVETLRATASDNRETAALLAQASVRPTKETP